MAEHNAEAAPNKFLEMERKREEGIFAEGSLYPMLRIGPYRIATVGAQCWVLEDGADVSEQIQFSAHTSTDSLQAAVDYCIARSVHHKGRDNYAVARWSVDDVHSYREENEMPEWTDEQASEFLAYAEGNIQDRMIEAGWEALETLIRMDAEDEDIGPCDHCGRHWGIGDAYLAIESETHTLCPACYEAAVKAGDVADPSVRA